MGMFDTFIYKCPHCHQETDAQTNLGEGVLDSWRLGDKTTVPDGFYRLAWPCHNCNDYAVVEIYRGGLFYMVLKEVPFGKKGSQEVIYGNLKSIGTDPKKILNEYVQELKKAFKKIDKS